MWQLVSQSSSSPGWVCALTPIWLDIVPDGTNRAASLPSNCATRSSRRLTVGSSPNTSSPSSAAFMAARIPAVGRLTVPLRRSIRSVMVSPPEPTVSRPAWMVNARVGLLLFLLVLVGFLIVLLLLGWLVGGVLFVFEIPPAVDLPKEDFLPEVFQLGRRRGLADVPIAFLGKAGEILDQLGIVGELVLDDADQGFKLATVDLADLVVNEFRVGELGQEVIDAALVEGLDHRGERQPSRVLREGVGVVIDVVAGGFDLPRGHHPACDNQQGRDQQAHMQSSWAGERGCSPFPLRAIIVPESRGPNDKTLTA